MLAQEIKSQVTSVFANLKSNFTLEITADESHLKKAEMIEFLEDVASCSDKVSVEIKSGEELSFKVKKNNGASSVIFKAIPNGHEFTTLLLAVLNQDGIGKNLPDDAFIQRIKSLKGGITLKSYISLTCTNCPDVVQALNIISFINPNIQHEIIDGGLYKEEVEALNIQAVPSVYAGNELLHVGRSSLGELLGKLEKEMGVDRSNQEVVKKEFDVVVVGGGPAGASAAIYSARKGFSVAIVAETIGGQVTETVSIENMISKTMTTGKELSADLLSHVKDYPIEVLENRLVESIEVVDGMKILKTSLGEELTTPAVIAATGASWRHLNVPGESQYIGSGVAFCTHCDGPFYKDKKVVVIGGGNSGLEAAIDLSSIASHVTVLEFADTLRGDQVLQEKLSTKSNVEIYTNAQTLKIDGDGQKVTSLTYRERTSGIEKEVITDGVFVQIGLSPNSGVFKDLVETNRMGEIMVDASCRTNVPGIYAAGDVSVVPYKQIVVAMGEGAKAALSAFEDNIKGLQIAS